MSKTGSLDKVMLEAMSCGIPVVSCNDAAREVFSKKFPQLLFDVGNHKALANKIKNIILMSDGSREVLCKELRKIVIEKNNLSDMIDNLIQYISK